MSERLTEAQIKLLERLDRDGPQVVPSGYSGMLKLWADELIDRHAPRRYRITELGRAALRDAPR